jgi:ribosomal protein S3
LLGTFIAEYLKTTKRHNSFFSSLSKSLNLSLKQEESRIKGIKILIKGRLNNAARSRNQYIKLGTIPLITKNRNIDYSESTAFTPNGTIGIKIWISHKKVQDIPRVKATQKVKSYESLNNF